MKLLLAFTLAAFIALVACDKKAEFEKVHNECMAEAKVTPEEMKAFFTNGMKASDAKDNIKCHMKCIMEKEGLLKGGAYDSAAAIAKLKDIPQLKDHMTEIEQAVNNCKSEKGANDCDTAFKITMCIKEFKANL